MPGIVALKLRKIKHLVNNHIVINASQVGWVTLYIAAQKKLTQPTLKHFII